MSKLHSITKHLTINLAAEIVMVAFAALSLANVEAFFHTIHPHGYASWIAGVALGSILVIMAALLARTETNLRDRGYVTMLGVTAGLTLISGLIQGAAYNHTLHWLPAYLLGLALPGFGELGLALAVAEYIAAEKRKRAAMADEGFEHRINDAISEALADLDVSAAKRHIERQAAAIIRHKMDEIVARRIGGTVTTETPQNATNDDSHTNVQEITTNANSDTQRPSPDELNERRAELVQERHAAIVQLCESYGAMSAPELVQRLADDRGIEVSAQTARDDCNSLVDAGLLVRSGRKWDRPMAIAETLPTMGQPVLNGASH